MKNKCMKKKFYTHEDEEGNKIWWSYCNYFDMKEHTKYGEQVKGKNSYAYLYSAEKDKVYPLTTDIIPDDVDALEKDGKVNGVKIAFESESSVCPFKKKGNDDVFFKWTNSIVCDPNIKGEGNGKILSVKGLDSCHPKIKMAHSSACSKLSIFNAVEWMEKKGWWAAGLILLVAGIFIGLFGNKLFSPVVCAVGAMIAFSIVFVISSIFGLQKSGLGFGLTIGVAVLLAVGAGILLWKIKKLELAVLGGAVGAFLGTFASSLIHSVFSYYSIWLYITLIILFCLGFVTMAFKKPDWLATFGTAVIGAYLFMRSMTNFFGHYPSQSKMIKMLKKGKTADVPWAVWVYYAVFIIMFIGFFVWQR